MFRCKTVATLNVKCNILKHIIVQVIMQSARQTKITECKYMFSIINYKLIRQAQQIAVNINVGMTTRNRY